MEPREPRKRIKYEPKGVPAIQDELEFIKNKCSDHAKKIFVQIENIHVELWFDKHYHDRHQHGDDEGKRTGIDPATVEALVRKSLKHLLFYSSAVAGFKFVNIGPSQPAVRVVLQEELENSQLNVVIEAHFLDIKSSEITVKTAMCTDDFRISMGQYCIEIQGDNSILRRKDNNRMIEICSI
jgi:hypothetical protein